MGCGESKHAVSTADTISLSKRSSSEAAKEDVIVKDVESTNDIVKIPQNDVESTNESNISKPQNDSKDNNKQGDSSAAAAVIGGQVSIENVVSDKKEDAQDLKKTDVVQETKGEGEGKVSESESRVEKIKEDEIKEVAAAGQVSLENVVSDKKEEAKDLIKTDVVQETKGEGEVSETESRVETIKETESRVETIKEDEIKEVAAAAAPPPPVAVVVEEEVAIKTAEPETKTEEEAHKEEEVDEIKEKEPEKSAEEAKESTNVAEEKISIVEEKVDDTTKVEDSADKDPKST